VVPPGTVAIVVLVALGGSAGDMITFWLAVLTFCMLLGGHVQAPAVSPAMRPTLLQLQF